MGPKAFRSIRLALMCLIGASVISFPAISKTQKMSFIFKPPSTPKIVFGTAWTIYADGPIDAKAARRFEALLIEKRIPKYSFVYLNSPGGLVSEGMELGRLFRKYGLNTDLSRDAFCLSACALAYIGGIFRYMQKGSVYGVHRFYSAKKNDDAENTAQILSAFIVQYLNETGINSKFFIEMMKAGPSEMSILSKTKLETLGVVNNGREKAKWSIKAAPEQEGFLYLIGERNTAFGINKFIIYCVENRSLQLHVIFDPQGRQDEVMLMGAQSLSIDDQTIPFRKFLIGKPEIVNGWLNSTYLLPESITDKFGLSKTVGFTFQHSYKAPVFLGFQGMSFEGGRHFFRGLRASCSG